MKAEDFKDSPSGHLVPTIEGERAFVPNPLPPPNLDLGRVAPALERATLALGELSGIGRTLPNPHLLIRPFSRIEAVASSKIEGTVTSLQELLMLEVGADRSRAKMDTKEVHNYTRAMEHGLQRLKNLPISKRLLCELHSVLMDGVSPSRGAFIVPGELKRDQNWIGGRIIQNARYVPPPPSVSEAAFDKLDLFIHRDFETLPLLVKLALIHYQFEAIHPYPDGNGRVGRLLIPLMLCERQALSQPLLYLSTYLEKHFDKYIDLMFEVSRSGAWGDWIEFFLQGVEECSKSAIKKSHELQDLQSKYSEQVQSARSSALLAKLVASLFAIPATTTPSAAKELNITYNTSEPMKLPS